MRIANVNSIKRISVRVVVIILSMFFVVKSYATNLGVVGHVYPIIEEDFLLFIQNRIALMQKNGEWNQIQSQFRNNVAKHADRPRAIGSISHTTQLKTWEFDPSITIPYDLNDDEGRLIAKAGTTVNPLKIISLHNVLIFFDGDDSKQVVLANKIDSLFKGKTKLILVNGSVIENEKRFSKAIYFDQEGRLVNHFGIQHVPAIVQQAGFKLKISEVVP